MWDKEGKPSAWSRPVRWTMGLLESKDWEAHWISSPDSTTEVKNSPTPLFRKEFGLIASPESAQVTIHSPAYFELYVNGNKVGGDVLTPAVSDQDQVTFTMTYDVNRYLRQGKNCMGLWLGIGWANDIQVRAQLDAVVQDQQITIGTDSSWKTHKSGRYRIGQRKWGDFGGERIDAREIIPNWCQPGLDDATWTSAIPTTVSLGPSRTHPCPTNRIGKTIPAVAVKTLDKDRYEVDFGTNLTGWLRFKMPKLKSGAKIRMTFADSKQNPRGNKEYQHFNQISEFISAGQAGEVFEHKFNYAAFRYVIVEGLQSAPPKENLTAFLIDSDLEEIGSFACSNSLLNRIHQINKWTQRCLNLGGYYVDCPHRERMGYGDGQVAVEGFLTSFNANRYYRKWLADWRRANRKDGSMPNTAPFYKGGGGPGWGGLFAAITWRHYLYYGDQRVLAENFDVVRKYVDYLEKVSQSNGNILTGKTGKFSFIGDWVAPGRGMDTQNAPSHKAREHFNNCYRIYQIGLLINMAEVLGKQDVVEYYEKVIDRIRPVIHKTFYDAETKMYVLDNQAYYVMPLMTGVTPNDERKGVMQKLEDCILKKGDGHLDTGMLGTYFMMEYLRDIGRSDLVFTMFNQTSYPGWGYMLENGATTLWEQWNGYWSRIHSCFTSPCNWLYQGLAGIQADPTAPGFKNVIIKPDVVGDVTWVKAHHDSPYGRIVSHWKREGDKLTMEVTVPPNSTATIYVPTEAFSDLNINGQPLERAEYVTLLRMENRRAILQVDSGQYVILSRYHTKVSAK
ncbi:family 78 glycoside hydrolase catalytic domain [Planctomycetota bacterium]